MRWVMAFCMVAGVAHGQASPMVVKPPVNVDPKMRVTPKPTAKLPTPVVKPPSGVVPK